MSSLSPVAADRIRKVVAGALAVGITVLLLRVLARTAHGRQEWLDPELGVLLVLVTLAFLWIRFARRVRRQ